jgi:hypothetical protein
VGAGGRAAAARVPGGGGGRPWRGGHAAAGPSHALGRARAPASHGALWGGASWPRSVAGWPSRVGPGPRAVWAARVAHGPRGGAGASGGRAAVGCCRVVGGQQGGTHRGGPLASRRRAVRSCRALWGRSIPWMAGGVVAATCGPGAGAVVWRLGDDAAVPGVGGHGGGAARPTPLGGSAWVSGLERGEEGLAGGARCPAALRGPDRQPLCEQRTCPCTCYGFKHTSSKTTAAV